MKDWLRGKRVASGRGADDLAQATENKTCDVMMNASGACAAQRAYSAQQCPRTHHRACDLPLNTALPQYVRRRSRAGNVVTILPNPVARATSEMRRRRPGPPARPCS